MQTQKASVSVPHNRLSHGEEEVASITEVVRSGYWAGGPKVAELEELLEQRGNMKHAIATSSGTSALRLALKGVGVTAGDEVILPAYSFMALPAAILACGATPVPVEVQGSCWNAEPQAIAGAITDKTAAILIVNTFGAPSDIAQLKELNLPIVEDCAHGFGVEVGDGVMGERGDCSIVSFYATKLMGGGEGGAVMTESDTIEDTIRSYIEYEALPPHGERLNDKMNDLEAAIAVTQFRKLDSFIENRKKVAERYNELLSPIAGEETFLLPCVEQKRIWYRYTIEMKSMTAAEASLALCERGITAIRPVDDWRQDVSSYTPIANRAYDYVLSLPIYPTLTEQEQDLVIDALKALTVS